MQILVFLLENLFFIGVGAALLRAWMNQTRLRMTEQPGVFVMAITDWLVKPLRRALPNAWRQSRWDWASILAADVLALLYALLLQSLGWMLHPNVDVLTWLWLIPQQALFMLLRTTVQGLLLLTFMYAILSWVQPFSPLQGTLSRLLEPLLQPLRRHLPPIGRVDLSVWVFMLILQVLSMALASY